MNATKEEILEKHYKDFNKRIAFPDNVFNAMDEYARQEAISFANFLSYADKGRKTVEQLWQEYKDITKPLNP